MDRLFIDVREPQEFNSGHVDGAVNIPPSELMSGAAKLKGIPKDTELVLYCVSGSRSNVAANILSSLGYTNIVNGINMHQVKAKFNL